MVRIKTEELVVGLVQTHSLEAMIMLLEKPEGVETFVFGVGKDEGGGLDGSRSVPQLLRKPRLDASKSE